METPQGLLIRLTAKFAYDVQCDHSDFREAALNAILDVLKTTNAELIYACQLDSNELLNMPNPDTAVFIVRLGLRKSKISTKTAWDEKQEILKLFVHNFTQRSHNNSIRQMDSNSSDIIDFEVEWKQFLVNHG